MKKRIAKKLAKAFLDGRKVYPTYDDTFIYTTDGDYCIKAVAVMPEPVRREVCAYAYRAGWSGCHWDAPDVLDTWFPGKEESMTDKNFLSRFNDLFIVNPGFAVKPEGAE